MAQLDQFALARQRATQNANDSAQKQKDALERRFAQLGNLNSGVQIKLQQQADTESQKNLEGALADINVAEQSDVRAREEAQKNRDFSKSERLGGQEFAAGQNLLGQRFQTSEREGGQKFAAGQAQLGRQFQTSERLGGQQFSAGQAKLGREFQTSERQAGQGFASSEAGKQRSWQSQQEQKNQQFQAGESKLSRDQQAEQFRAQQAQQSEQFGRNLQQQQNQFNETFKQEKEVNDANIAFNRQILGDQSAIPEWWESTHPGQKYGGSVIAAPAPTSPVIDAGSWGWSRPSHR